MNSPAPSPHASASLTFPITSRPTVQMPTVPNASPVPAPSPSIELGYIAAALQRILSERFQAPPDDPIHSMVEVVRSFEMVGLHLVAAMSQRGQAEGRFLEALNAAQSDIGQLASRERQALEAEIIQARTAMTELNGAVAGSQAAFNDMKPLIEGLPALQAALREDVDSRAKERTGVTFVIVITALLFLLLGLAVSFFFFNHFLAAAPHA